MDILAHGWLWKKDRYQPIRLASSGESSYKARLAYGLPRSLLKV